MKAMTFIKGMVACMPFLWMACSDTGQEAVEDSSRILVSIDEFKGADGSRTVLNTTDYSVTWKQGDVIGIFPYEGYQEPFAIPDEQAGSKKATFDGGYWAVKDGHYYNAYYPFHVDNFVSADMKNRIAVSYEGQTQNGSSCDIGDYLFTYSEWKEPTDGKISFQFHHIGCLVIAQLTYPATDTYTSLSLCTGNESLIPLEGTYNLTSNKDTTPQEGETYVKIPFVADNGSKATSLSLALTNCSGTQGQTGTFYLMVPPMDLRKATSLSFKLTGEDGMVYEMTVDGTLFESGQKYVFTLGNLIANGMTGNASDSDDSEFSN